MNNLTTIQNNNNIQLKIWNNNVVLCRRFARECLLFEDNKHSQSIQMLLDHRVIKEFDSMATTCGCNIPHEISRSIIIDILCLISKFYEDDNNIEECIIRLRNRLLCNNNIFLLMKNECDNKLLVSLLNIKLFLCILCNLKIDDRLVFTEYKELERFLYNLAYRCNPISVKRCIIISTYDNILVHIKTLVEDYNNKQLFQPTKLQHYSELEKFITNVYSPLKGNFTVLRFL